MNTSTLCRMGATILITCLVGCAPARVSLRPSFWTETQHKVGVATLPPPQFAAYRGGSQGLLDMAINSAMADSMEAHLQSLDASRFETLADRFVEKLNERGINARRLPRSPIALEPSTSISSDELEKADLRPVAEKENIDLLVLLSLKQCGTTRNYYGFIPLGPPEALCVSQGELIDLKTNQVVWRAYPDYKQSTLAVAGEWDEPPDYRSLTAAINQAFTLAQVFLFEDFFGPNTAHFETQALAVRGESAAPQPKAQPKAQPEARIQPGCTNTPEYQNASAVEKKRLLEKCRTAGGQQAQVTP